MILNLACYLPALAVNYHLCYARQTFDGIKKALRNSPSEIKLAVIVQSLI